MGHTLSVAQWVIRYKHSHKPSLTPQATKSGNDAQLAYTPANCTIKAKYKSPITTHKLTWPNYTICMIDPFYALS